ncbi:hypothetical protein [Hyphomicrobium sp. DY-1]|uniref:DUF7693 family protein n=1 Tax=Hyphomicrobium sp. DY-1 TaxID=3075650 RepID=UPI0039C23C00
MTPIPATMVLSVLQRVAEGQAENVRFDGDMMFTIYADGWQIECFDDAGVFDGVYQAISPDGAIAEFSDWDLDVEPSALLSDEHADVILKLVFGDQG